MGLPKGFRKKVNFINQKIGPEKRQGFLDKIDYKGTYLPKSVSLTDIDRTFIDFVDNNLEMTIDGTKVPVIFLTIQRWAEFSKTWAISDKYKNLKMPFITIVRQPHVQVGTNQNSLWNIPGHKLYTYVKVPTFIDGRKGIDTYKIPQPTSLDVTYEVRLFCNRMKDLNIYHKIIQTAFNSRQYYINVNEHPMPVHLEQIGDESQKDNFDKRRFYVQHFEMKLLGYILDENDFEVIPSINRGSIQFKELTESKKSRSDVGVRITSSNNETSYSFNFFPNSLLTFSFMVTIDLLFDEISNVTNITNIIISVNNVELHNGLVITSDISVNNGDTLTVEIETNDINNNSLFDLNGNIR
jgi:hypothetical protein